MLCALPVFTELASTCLFHARCFSLLHFLCLEMAFSSCLSSTPLSLASLMHACLYNFSQFVVFSPFSPRSSLPLASTTSSVWIFSCNLAGHQGQDTCAAGAKLQSSRHLSFPFLSSPAATQPRWYNVMGAAGEDESPDSHPDHSVQENAKFSGLSIILRAQVQVMEDTGGHLGPSLVNS